MNIAIVTHYLKQNYGGNLQAFALQATLKRLGHNPVTIDLLPGYRSLINYCLAQTLTILHRLLGKKDRVWLHGRMNEQRAAHFDRFLQTNLSLTKPFNQYSLAILKRLNPDAIIVGSDQVWRCAFYSPAELEDKFLKFAHDYDAIKIAYAASFGIDEWDYPKELEERCARYAKDFKAISVREDSGVDLCRQHLGVDAVHVLDPTLLLDANDYKELCSSVPVNNSKYLLAYILNPTDEISKQISEFAYMMGLEALFVSSETEAEKTVEEWLAMLRDASFVVTNSFHGTAFSINFNKNFYSISNKSRGNSRFTSLLKSFGLENRLLDDFKYLSSISSNNIAIDWQTVNSRKKVLQDFSIDFLKQNLKK